MTYEAILSANRLEDVVGSYWRLIPSGKLLKSSCPFCDDDTDLEGVKKNERETFFVNPKSQTWVCLLCFSAGSVLDFTRMIEDCSFDEAIKLLENRITKGEKHGIQTRAPRNGV